MTERRPTRDLGNTDDRIIQALGRLGDRLDTAVETINSRLESVDRRQAGNEQDMRGLRGELMEAKREAADMRDLIRQEGAMTREGQNEGVASAATAGAAKGSAEGAMAALKPMQGRQIGIAIIATMAGAAEIVTNGGKLLAFLLKLFNAGDPGGGDAGG